MSCLSLVIVHDFEVDGTLGAFRPLETDPPLIVDADAILTRSISAQRFEPAAGQRGKVAQRGRRLETVQLQLCRPLNSGKCLDAFARRKVPRPLVAVPENHLRVKGDVRVTS